MPMSSGAAKNNFLRVAHSETKVSSLGPGHRAAIWFQGCTLNCPGCVAAQMNAAEPSFYVSPRGLADWCIAQKGIQGVTLSGGDPLDQPLTALADFLGILRRKTKLDVVMYTGRTLLQLNQLPGFQKTRILEMVDILIDGPYIEKLNNGLGWRGSSNQKIHWLSGRLKPSDAPEPKQRKMEVIYKREGGLSIVGLPARGRAGVFAQNLLSAAISGENAKTS